VSPRAHAGKLQSLNPLNRDMPRRSPQMTEAAMLAAERRIPELAAKSGHAAYKLALATTGAVVVKTSKGTLVERKADGTSTLIKALRPGKRVKVGLVLKRAKQEAA
jgi:protein PhnA